MPDAFAETPFHVDHVRARQHRGATVADNLAYCCGWCNLHKGPNLSAVDPSTDRAVLLYSPRRSRWASHFEWDGPTLVGRTACGRATVALLDCNDDELRRARERLIAHGEF